MTKNSVTEKKRPLPTETPYHLLILLFNQSSLLFTKKKIKEIMTICMGFSAYLPQYSLFPESHSLICGVSSTPPSASFFFLQFYVHLVTFTLSLSYQFLLFSLHNLETLLLWYSCKVIYLEFIFPLTPEVYFLFL